MEKVRSRLTFSNVVACVALFVALGGSAYAVAINSVGTKQLKNNAVTKAKLANNAVTTKKLANNAVTAGKLANNAVTTGKLANNAVTTGKLANNAVTTGKLANNSVNSAKVVDNSLTANDIAPNTFLAAGGTAANSLRLGGLLPADFVQGVGIMEYRRIVVLEGTSGAIFLNTLFGTFTANCDGTGKMSITWTPTVSNAEYFGQFVHSGASPTISTLNGILAGTPVTDPTPTTAAAQSFTYQIGYTSGLDHEATAFITGRVETPNCVFIGQEFSSG